MPITSLPLVVAPLALESRRHPTPAVEGAAQIWSRLFRTLALAAHADCPRWCAKSSTRDYVRALLGLKWGTWCAWRRIGLLLLASPDTLSAFHRGELTVSALDLLARYCPVDRLDCILPLAARLSYGELRELLQDRLRVDSGDPANPVEPEPGWEQLHLGLPGDLLPYVEESLELARALLGRQVDDHEALDALLAEAADHLPEGEPTPDEPAEDRVRGRHRAPRQRLQRLPAVDIPRADRSRARALHRLSERLLRAARRLELEEEDQLLASLEAGAHRDAGYKNFEHYCSQVLRLAPSTAWDRIRRARRRRAGDPVARARAEGRLTVVQHDLLAQLGEIGVAADALPEWIELAPRVPTLRLQGMVRWAGIQAATRRREWAADGFAPPSAAQLRESSRPLDEIVVDPDPPALETLDTGNRASLRLRLPSELAAALRDALDRIQRASADDHGRRLPRWWAFLHVLGLARQSWAANVRDPGARQRMRAVFERDRYICQAPDCSWRRNLQSHHLTYRSRGGGDELSNLLTLCPFHHQQGEHGGLLRVRGKVVDSTDDLEWELGLDARGRRPLLRYRGGRVVEPRVEGVRVGA